MQRIKMIRREIKVTIDKTEWDLWDTGLLLSRKG